MLIIFTIFLWFLAIFALACFFIVIKGLFSLLGLLFSHKRNQSIHDVSGAAKSQPHPGVWAQIKRSYITARDAYNAKHGTKTFGEIWEQFKKDYSANLAAYKKKHNLK